MGYEIRSSPGNLTNITNHNNFLISKLLFMKNLLCTLLVLVPFCFLGAQIKNSPMYIAAGTNIGKVTGVNLVFNLGFYEKNVIGIGIEGSSKESDNVPSDFSCFFCSTRTSFNGFSVNYGRIIPLDLKSKVRLKLNAGFGFYKHIYPTNFTYTTITVEGDHEIGNIFDFSGTWKQYKYEMKSVGYKAIIIRPQIEFALSRYAGLSLSPLILHIGSKNVNMGTGIEIMLGKLR